MLLLLLTGAAAVGLRAIGSGPRLVSDTAAEPAPAAEAGGTAPGQVVALSDRAVVALDSQTGAERRMLADLALMGAPAGGFLQGISVTPDGRCAYFALADDMGGSIYVVDTDGGEAPSFVAEGSPRP